MRQDLSLTYRLLRNLLRAPHGARAARDRRNRSMASRSPPGQAAAVAIRTSNRPVLVEYASHRTPLQEAQPGFPRPGTTAGVPSMSLLRSLTRWAAPPIAGLSLLFLSPPPALAQDPPATVSAGAPSGPVTLASTASVPITLARGATTPILGYSVSLTVSPGLTASADDITEGAFLTASGATTSFHVVDHGGGNFTVGAVTLGSPCASGGTAGTRFTLPIGSTIPPRGRTALIDSVLLRHSSDTDDAFP